MARMAMARVGLSLLVLGVTFTRGAPAAANEDPESLIQQGVELRRKGQDALAEGYLRRAYELAATPRTAAQLGLVEYALAEYVDAEAHLSEALKSSKDRWIAQYRKILEDSREVARKHLLRVEVAGAPAGTTLTAEGGQPRPLPSDGVVFTAPGTSTNLRFEASGRKPTSATVQGREGETKRVAIEMPTLMEAPQTLPPPAVQPAANTATPTGSPSAQPPETQNVPAAATNGRGLRIAGITVGAIGVAAGVLGGILYAQGSSRRDEYRNAINSNGNIPYNPKDANWQTLQTAGVVCLVGAGVAVAGGVGLYVFGRRASEESASVALLPGPGFGLLTYRRGF